ncbi:PBECR4 domain-containing protein [Streptococcus dentiloxodontae]
MASIEDLKQLSIIDVAERLGMTLKQESSRYYQWEEHDSFQIDTHKNTFSWYSRGTHGDVFDLVQTIREEQTGEKVSFGAAKKYLETGEFKTFEAAAVKSEPFEYRLTPYENADFTRARAYLTQERGLSDETINFFGRQGVLAEAQFKTGDLREPIVVFKTLNRDGEVTGASLQGIESHPESHERGRLKRLLRASDGLGGMHVDIGEPKRLVFAEAPIDLMSYYETHKDLLQDVRLVAMDGLKEGTVSRYTMELIAEKEGKNYQVNENTWHALENTARLTNYLTEEVPADFLTLAVDNDAAGRQFVERLQAKTIPVLADLPPLAEGQTKTDWNDYLKDQKGNQVMADNHPSLDSSKDIEKAPGDQELSLEGTDASKGSLQPEAEGSPTPVSPRDTFEQTVTSHPTVSLPYLHFSTDQTPLSKGRPGYHVITEKELAKLNNYAGMLQEVSHWYRETLADSNVHYFVIDGQDTEVVKLTFEKHHFAHLTGVQPVETSLTASQVLDKLADGQGHFDNILIANQNNAFKKLGVLPNIKSIVNAKSFYFDQLQDLQRFERIDVSKAIQSDDEDLLLAFRTEENQEGDYSYPVSLQKVKGGLKTDIATKDHKAILGIYREKDGQLEQLSINDEYVKDNGAEMLSVLTRGDLEPVQSREEPAPRRRSLSDRFQEFRSALRRPQQDAPKAQSSQPATVTEDLEKTLEKTIPAPQVDTVHLGPSQPVSSFTDDAAAQTVSEMIANKDTQALSKHMKEGVRDFFQSDQYKTFLQTMAKFPKYSFNNVQLLMAQDKDVSLVTSFKKWKSDFDRSVIKGSKALRIWAPTKVTRKDKNGDPILDKDGKPETYTRFILVPVFDVSQTEGKDLPKMINELEGTMDNYAALYRSARDVSLANGVPISIDKTLDANGVYLPQENKIFLKPGMSQQQTLKTLFHEMAHSDLHNPEVVAENITSYSTAELQAESVAYVVTNHYGFDTSEYSFGYLASWSQDKQGLKDLEDQLKIVQKEASSLIERIDTQLEKHLNQEVTQDKFTDKLNSFKEASTDKASNLSEKTKEESASKKLSSQTPSSPQSKAETSQRESDK